MECWNHSDAQQLFRHQYTTHLAECGIHNRKGVHRLIAVVQAAQNIERTRPTGRKPKHAIRDLRVHGSSAAKPPTFLESLEDNHCSLLKYSWEAQRW